MADICTFEIKIESQNFYHALSNEIDHIKMKIKIVNRIQEHPASSKAPNQDLKNMDVLCTFKIKIMRQNSEHGSNKD